jgi:ferredoxin--NADP+ reductase
VNVLLQAVHEIGNDIPSKRTRSLRGRRDFFCAFVVIADFHGLAPLMLSTLAAGAADPASGMLQPSPAPPIPAAGLPPTPHTVSFNKPLSLVDTTITGRRDWAPGLMTLRLAEHGAFRPGQFMNFGLYLPAGFVSRSYSLASAPGQPLEILLARVGAGELTPALFELREGACVVVDTKPQGFFSFEFVPPHRELWMLATGTGLGPFLSMLRSGIAFERAERVILAHGTRGPSELAHREELEQLVASRAGAFSYVPVLSRQHASGLLTGRLTAVLPSGELEARAGLQLDPTRCHVMLCGNPAMIDEVTAQLAERGLRRHRQRAPGQITTEKYW